MISKVLIEMKKSLLPVDNMYKLINLNKKKAYGILAILGGKHSYVAKNIWRGNFVKTGDCTYQYCHCMTSLAYYCFNEKDKLVPMLVRNPELDINHFFLVLRKNGKSYIIDLTLDQFLKKNGGQMKDAKEFPYELAIELNGTGWNNLKNSKKKMGFRKDFMNLYKNSSLNQINQASKI